MGLKNKLKVVIVGLTNTQQAILLFAASVLPPVLVLLQEQSTNPFLYGAAIVGGALVFVIKMLGSSSVQPS
jgi:hypothetical protein